jgi:hypothetical protein
VGAGRPLEVGFTLPGAIDGGSYHLVGDGMVTGAPEVSFDVIWRHTAIDSPVVGFVHPFPATGQYEESQAAMPIAAAAGDLLVLRLSVKSADPNAVYMPYGEDARMAAARLLTLDIPWH